MTLALHKKMLLSSTALPAPPSGNDRHYGAYLRFVADGGLFKMMEVGPDGEASLS